MHGEAPPSERRHHSRFPLVLRVDHTDAGDTRDLPGEWTENVSASGVFVRTDRPFAPGATVSLSLSFPGLLAPVTVVGRVAWVREAGTIQPGGVGVEVTSDPARQCLGELTARAAHAAELTTPKPFRVLVVEDNSRVVRSYERIVTQFSSMVGGRIDLAFVANGKSALAAIEKAGVDLLITDLYMPVMDGFALIEKVRANPTTKKIPIIVITGGHADERERVAALGIDGFLHKPVQLGQLLETIVCLACSRPAPPLIPLG